MTRTLLLIENEGFSLQPVIFGSFDRDTDYRYERLDWNEFLPDALGRHPADLIVPVALGESARTIELFDFVRQRPIHTPLLAILPEPAEAALLRSAARSTVDFMMWPAQPEEFTERVSRILGVEAPAQSVRDKLADELGLAMLVGYSPAFLELLAKIPRVSRCNSPVLIVGETGTGKELVARAIHHLGKRRDFPFIPVDCAAFPDHLFENEMFGHARGAFTDAHCNQKGLIALAEGGTLFLDEIDSLSPSVQAKLLRFLQEKTYRPLGGDRFLQADVNVLAATNRDLERLVDEHRFRADLFFRLNVIRLDMLPLRERREDIPVLAQHFIDRLSHEYQTIPKALAPATLAKLSGLDWPGNVRQLFNLIQRAFLLADGYQILPSDIEVPEAAVIDIEKENFAEARARTVAAFERCYLVQLLTRYKGNITQAARHAGKDRRVLGRLVKRYGIDCKSFS